MTVRIRHLTQFSKSEIDQLWQNVHQALKHDGFLLLKAPRHGTVGRILIVISKKVGNAPTRNKKRRQIKSLFYENKIYEKKFDWIIVVKEPSTKLTFQELSALLLPVMSNA